jgi:1,4-beta-D-xylan synthase
MSSPAAAGGGHGGISGRLADPLLVASNDDGDIVVSAKDKYWVPSDEKEILAAQDCGGGAPPLLYRTFRVKGFLINLYRCVSQLCSPSFVVSIKLLIFVCLNV